MNHDRQPSSAGFWSRRRSVLLACIAVGLVCLTILFVYLAIHIRRGHPTTTSEVELVAPPIYRYSRDDLSALGAYLSDDLDEGRLRAAPPVDWYVKSRDKQFVAQFVFDRTEQSPLPRIRIEAQDAGASEPGDVTEANLYDFLAHYRKSLDERTHQALERSLLVLVLGDVPCIAYTVHMEFRAKNKRAYPGERHVLVTHRRGRRYTVALDVYAGKLLDFQADVYAVVAGLQFVPPAAAGAENTPTAEADSDTDGVQQAAAADTEQSPQ
jgi:hypothetical protein